MNAFIIEKDSNDAIDHEELIPPLLFLDVLLRCILAIAE